MSDRYPADAELATFRIAQEALTNVARHSGARRVIVELRDTRREVLFTIEDDGKGFERDRLPHGRGYGMSTMRERANAIGGTLEVRRERRTGAPDRGRVPATLILRKIYIEHVRRVHFLSLDLRFNGRGFADAK